MSQFSGIAPSVTAGPTNPTTQSQHTTMPAGYYGAPLPTHVPNQHRPVPAAGDHHYCTHGGPHCRTPHEYALYYVPPPHRDQGYGSDSFMEKYAMIGLYNHLQRGGRESYKSAIEEARKLIKEERLDAQYRTRGYSRRECGQNRGRGDSEADNRKRDTEPSHPNVDKRGTPRSPPNSREASPTRGRNRGAHRDTPKVGDPGQSHPYSTNLLTTEDLAAFERVVRALVEGLADLATHQSDEPMAAPSHPKAN
ncbi:hypothetical protein JB92DRAFT_3131686 [Gautieria morchelliformis]|nr:hypothetical protein JB92DRAFT_3131686 [Gautieria morchelliformis]